MGQQTIQRPLLDFAVKEFWYTHTPDGWTNE